MDVHAPDVASDSSILDRFRIADPSHDPSQRRTARADATATPTAEAADRVLLSPAARELSDRSQSADDGTIGDETRGSKEETDDASKAAADDDSSASAEQGPGELTEEEEIQVRELRDRDREVRAHENAHKAAAGGLARGGPVYEYETGPDGRRYAVGGHVNISVGEGRTPQETLQNASQARRAALAPAEPSGQDRAVAAKAAALAAEARQQIAEERRQQAEEANGNDSESDDAAATSAGSTDGEANGASTSAASIDGANTDEDETSAATGASAFDGDTQSGTTGIADTSSSLLGLAIDAYGAATRRETPASAFGLVG